MTVEALIHIEQMLRERLKAGPNFVLGDYFDFVAGTSTGAIIAACVALGMPAARIRDFYSAATTTSNAPLPVTALTQEASFRSLATDIGHTPAA